jgi:ribosomal protein S18 acetylase RimI-like enzyme
VLAYDAEASAIGWCAVAPRAELPTLQRSRLLGAVDDQPVWSINCFFVKPGQRRRGLALPLARAAVELARGQGAGIVEAYPWDTADRRANGTVYTGLVSTFRRLGFAEVARRAPHRPIMRLALDLGSDAPQSVRV